MTYYIFTVRHTKFNNLWSAETFCAQTS
ncbi:hypothetical protein AGR6A_pTi0018 [Agrobacterium sp. NCPPB 925]|nr:hypothetical protein AGR6A_pTi0018 [Agrobacterium sp. NCPPB 925]